MKVTIIYDDGTNEEVGHSLDGVGAAKSIENAKEFVAKKHPPETRKVKMLVADEDFL